MRNTLIAASALALLAGGANAAVLSYSYTASVGGTDISGATSGSFYTLSLEDFDSTLGDLIGIEIVFSGDWSAEYRAVADTSTGTASASANFVDVTIQNPLANVTPTVPTMISEDGTAFSQFVDFGAPYNQFVDGTFGTTLNPVNFGDYTDVTGGFLNYFFSGSANRTDNLDNGLLSGVQDFLYDIDATVTYTYRVSDVPAPAALPLLAAAFGVMGFVRARRA